MAVKSHAPAGLFLHLHARRSRRAILSSAAQHCHQIGDAGIVASLHEQCSDLTTVVRLVIEHLRHRVPQGKGFHRAGVGCTDPKKAPRSRLRSSSLKAAETA